MIVKELKCIRAIIDGLIKDAESWEEHGEESWMMSNPDRIGGTKTGICNTIKLTRRLLLQVLKEVEDNGR